VQLLLGLGAILTSTLIAGTGFVLLEATMERARPWLLRPPHRIKLVGLLCAAMLWTLVIVTAGIWVWALLLRLLGLFATLEAALYFAVVAFTTLGFGDVLLPAPWRLLSGAMALNGLLMIGLLTAMLVEVIRRVRGLQSGGRDWTS